MRIMGSEDGMTEHKTGSADQEELRRYRMLEKEVTDPLAVGLIRDIVRELETEQAGGPASVFSRKSEK